MDLAEIMRLSVLPYSIDAQKAKAEADLVMAKATTMMAINMVASTITDNSVDKYEEAKKLLGLEAQA